MLEDDATDPRQLVGKPVKVTHRIKVELVVEADGRRDVEGQIRGVGPVGHGGGKAELTGCGCLLLQLAPASWIEGARRQEHEGPRKFGCPPGRPVGERPPNFAVFSAPMEAWVIGSHGSRCRGVDPDASLAEFLRQPLGEGDDGALGGGVRLQWRRGPKGLDGCDVDDRGAPSYGAPPPDTTRTSRRFGSERVQEKILRDRFHAVEGHLEARC
ncbi:hypothetical protein HEB94_000346 [Actinopolymorpha pittospori]|uniref:Uncharacterized protein n=1 Tax=Actinopolymorpha pittospori TaxID=648752 RepID=A0A927RHI5_9ACTN|nr:hypothetical protein [Actinopolymorpha pittospori]